MGKATKMAALPAANARRHGFATPIMRLLRDAGFTFVVLMLVVSMEPTDSLKLQSRRIANITISRNATDSDGITSFRFVTKDQRLVADVSLSQVAAATEFDISNNRLVTIPAALFQAMTSVKRIILSQNPIRTFEPKSFYQLPQLREIVMEKSNLSNFPADFIVDCPLLKRVQINSSYVHTIPSKSVANLPSLEVIDLSRNNITKLSGDSFFNLSAIHTLDLSYNNLTGVPTDLFTVSKSWQVLDFLRNNISAAPEGLKLATVDGWVSFERNIWVEIHEQEFANASKIRELNVRSNGIFTVHSKAFYGMKALQKLDLGDNVISMLASDAFDGLDNLETLSLKENNLRAVAFDVFPPKLKSLGLESNQIDEMPTFSETVNASSLKSLNLSHNWLWQLETGTQLYRYENLVELDLSWNRLTNFTSSVFDSISKTIEIIHLDYNEIQSVPRTTFLNLFQHNRTNVTLEVNPGIGTTNDVQYRSICPGGSVYEAIDNPFTEKPSLFGCIQCGIGTYHETTNNSCQSCQGVSSRAYTATDGATTCLYCPYSSDLHLNREQCQPFACNIYCWLTIIVAMAFPLLMMGSKCLVNLATRTDKRSEEETLEEQDAMDDWVVEQLIRQVQTTRSMHGGAVGGEDSLGKIYDLPKDTQSTVLGTLQENFFQRRAKTRQQAADGSKAMDSQASIPLNNAADQTSSEWDDLEWDEFEMSRILSRNYHGEVFLGNYDATTVVVKRLMTLRFDVRELFDTIREVEMMLTLKHDHIVQYMGTIWTDAEYFCVICEYVPSGDLRALLELEATNTAAAAAMSARPLASPRSSSKSMSKSDASVMMLAWLPTKLQIIKDVVTALAFVHDQQICHRDLRSRNVLVTESYRAKLNDFRRTVNAKYVGTTITVTANGLAASEEVGGPVSLPVIAPEVVLQPTDFQPSADIYATGILLAELWCHKHLAFSVANVPGTDHRGSMASERSVTAVETMDSLHRQALYRVDDAQLQQFLKVLRACVEDVGADGTVSSTGTSVMAAMMTEKVLHVIQDCLQRDPRKRPTARSLVETFAELHRTATSSSKNARATRGTTASTLATHV